MWTVAQLERDLMAGRTTSRELVEQALAKIAAPYGEGARAFIKVHADSARAQAEGMCVMALGSDTRGSIRQPAALCGVVGFKPTARRVPRDGAFPLSYTLDSVGPLANSVACCAAYDAVLSGDADELVPLQAKGLRLLLPRSMALDDLDTEVDQAFARALQKLGAAGVQITEMPVPAFNRQDEYFKGGGIAGAEVVHVHKPYAARFKDYDPRVGKRIAMGSTLSGADLVELLHLRAAFIRAIEIR